MKKIALFLLLFCLMQSCKKGVASYTLSGHVNDNTFSKGLEGATVSVTIHSPKDNSIQTVGTATVKADGTYEVTFERQNVSNYHMTVEKLNYFTTEKDVNPEDLTIKENNVYNFSTTAKAWVNLRFINVGPDSENDILYYLPSGKSNCAECCATGGQNIYGACDTSIICINDGNQIYKYFYNVVGQGNDGEKSIITTAFDTVTLELNY
jgi:5-hydroxyisourate hydrolase-like protein (transthyretin family)